MSEQQAHTLGYIVRDARQAKQLSTRALADRVGVNMTTIVRIENGELRSPRPNILEHLAAELEIPLSDLYALANYTEPDGLPTLTPYLRTRYGGIPPEELSKLESEFARIAKAYGYDGDGPAPGEDET